MPGSRKGERRGNAGKGRRKGVPNRINRDVKEMVLQALNKAGGAQYLVEQAQANPSAFLTLVGRILPLTLTGDGTPITIKLVKYDGAGDEWQPPIIEHEPPQLPASRDLDTASGTILPR